MIPSLIPVKFALRSNCIRLRIHNKNNNYLLIEYFYWHILIMLLPSVQSPGLKGSALSPQIRWTRRLFQPAGYSISPRM